MRKMRRNYDLKVENNYGNKSRNNYLPLDNLTTMSYSLFYPYSWMKISIISLDSMNLIVLLSLTWYIVNVMHKIQLSPNMQPKVIHS